MFQLQLPGGPMTVILTVLVLLAFVILGFLFVVLRRLSTVESNRQRDSKTEIEPNGTDSQSARVTDSPRNQTSQVEQVESETLSPAVRQAIDGIASILLILLGAIAVVAGLVLSRRADRTELTRLVEEEILQSDVLSDELFVEVVYNSMIWGGYGLFAAGILILLTGVLLVLYRLRLDRSAEPTPGSAPFTASNALVGVVVSIVTSSIPFSVVIGGVAAGYLQQGDSWAGFRVGLLSGLFLAVPLFIVLGAIIAGVVAAGLLVIGLLLFFGMLFSLLYAILLSALGGYVGGYLVTRSR